MPFFSIIIPVYNTSQYIDQAINSVLTQQFKDFELILIDDCSTDGSLDTCIRHSKHDSRIKLIKHTKNCGVAISRNDGLETAMGKYVLFLDSDDYFNDDIVFSELYDKLCAHPSDIILYGYNEYDVKKQKNKKLQIGFSPDAFKQDKEAWLNYIYDAGFFPRTCWMIGVSKKMIDKYEMRFPPSIICEDVDWVFQLMYRAESYTFANRSLMTYRRNRSGSIMNHRGTQHFEGSMFAIKHWIQTPHGKTHLGLTNYVAHMHGFLFTYLPIIERSKRQLFKEEMINNSQVLIESDKWNHHLIYYSTKLLGVRFTSLMVRIVYHIYYSPSSLISKIKNNTLKKRIS